MAQGSDIRGVVTDSVTGRRIPYANIVLEGGQKGAAANEVGFYLLPNISAGTKQISASAVGYQKQTIQVVVQAGQILEINFRLVPQTIELEEVVVTARARPEFLDIHTSVHLLEQQDLKRVPATLQEDVFRSLTILPGIVSTSDVTSKFYVRGGAGDQNLILLDGMKIYNPLHALGIFSVFDPDVVQSAEVYTGAFPPGFGNRLSSVVNISSVDGRDDRISGKANFNFLTSKLLLEGPAFSSVSWFLNGRKSLFDRSFKNLIKQEIPVSFYDVFLKLSTTTDQGIKATLSTLLVNDELVSNNREEPDYFWRTKAIGLSVAGLLTDRIFVTSRVNMNSFFVERDPKSSNLLNPSSSTVREIGVRATGTYYTDRGDFFLFGFDFDFPELEYKLVNNVGAHLRLRGSSPNVSSWVRYQAKWERWQIDGGMHTDLSAFFVREGTTREIWQPRIHASYLLGGDWRAKASFGTYTQNAITATNEDDIISIFDPWIQIPLTLRSEQADHYVIGVDGNPARNISTSLQAYYKDYRSLVTYNRNKIDEIDPDYVNGKGHSYGFEVLVRAAWTRVDLYGTYAYSRTIIDNQGFRYHPRYDRRHQINVLGTFHLAEGFDANLRWEYGSGFPFTQTIGFYDRLRMNNALPGPFEFETGEPYMLLGAKNAARLPDNHRLDIAIIYRFTIGPLRGLFGVNVINVYNQKNLFYFDRKTGQRVDMLSFFPSATLTIEY